MARNTSQPVLAPNEQIAETKRRVSAGQFAGFGLPESNWFKSPNALTDLFARIITDEGDEDLDIPPGTPAACIVLHYIIRHTWGYLEYGKSKRITIDEFVHGRKTSSGGRMDYGTGLAQRTIVTCLKYLERRGFVDVIRDDSDRGRTQKLYRPRLAPGAEERLQ